MLKAELLTALQPAFAQLSESGVRYSALPGHTLELADSLNEILSRKWKELRGIVIASFGINSVSASKEDEDMIKQLQKSAVMRDPTMAAATLAGAQAEAMRSAASNTSGAMTGFMGMGMAQQAGGANMQNLYAMGAQQAETRAQQEAASAGSWKCSCGAVNTGKFCSECGAKQPEAGWKCSCGAVNTGKFCSECGAKKPETDWTCGCGTVNTGKFCSNCGSKRPE
jgi:membrane protease subunit (stomatin/prohibitin family)